MSIRCRHRLPSPELAGYCDIIEPDTGEVVSRGWDRLREAARRHPEIRPCLRCKGKYGSWHWIERRYCMRCPDAVRSDSEGRTS